MKGWISRPALSKRPRYRPCPSSSVPLFQSESKCKIILLKMTLITASGTHFHMKGFALTLVSKPQRHNRIRKWPMERMHMTSWQPLWHSKRKQLYLIDLDHVELLIRHT